MTPGRAPSDSQRFTTHFDAARLVEVVRAVARHANPGEPDAAPPAAYEAARALAGFPDAPGVRATRRALGDIGWYELLHIAFHDERSLEHNIALRAREPGRPVSEQEAVVALRLIAARLRVDTLRPHEYDEELAALEASEGDTHLPSATRIEAVLKTDAEMGWDRGLRLAGLKPRDRRPVRGRGMTAADATELFFADVGCLPWGREGLLEWAKQRGVSLTVFTAGDAWQAIDAFCDRRRAEGLWTPDAPPAQDRRPVIEPDFFCDAEAKAPRAANRGGGDIESVVAGLVFAYDRAAEKRLRLTQKVHRQLAKQHQGVIPAPSVVDRTAKKHGTTAAALRDEAKRRRAVMPSAPEAV